MFEMMINVFIDLFSVFAFSLVFHFFIEKMLCSTALLYICYTHLGYSFGYKFGQTFRVIQIKVQIHQCISRLEKVNIKKRVWILTL